MATKQKLSTLGKLSKDYPAIEKQPLIHFMPYQTLAGYSVCFRESADRLAKTFNGQAPDDMILMPYLTLYRQAFELLFKDIALMFASERRRTGDSDPKYSEASMAERIGSRGFGHRIEKAYDYMNEERASLGLDSEPLPDALVRVVKLLQNLDPAGTNFRYPDDNLNEVLRINFTKLHEDLHTAIDWLWAVYDHSSDALGNLPSR